MLFWASLCYYSEHFSNGFRAVALSPPRTFIDAFFISLFSCKVDPSLSSSVLLTVRHVLESFYLSSFLSPRQIWEIHIKQCFSRAFLSFFWWLFSAWKLVIRNSFKISNRLSICLLFISFSGIFFCPLCTKFTISCCPKAKDFWEKAMWRFGYEDWEEFHIRCLSIHFIFSIRDLNSNCDWVMCSFCTFFGFLNLKLAMSFSWIWQV